ncbi:hypothetical protein ABHI18_010767 [Aspergillus niger]
MPKSSQYSLPATYYRGGTSKALFFREDVLPGPGPQRDRLLKRAMGSPDPCSSTVGVARDFIHYGANCGNISAAVGPFAIEEGLVQFRPGRSVDMTVKTQERSGAFEPEGTHEIAGVPGKGSPVLLDYRFTIGVELSRGLLPTGNASDMITVAKKEIEITICDIANLCVFANARDFNITGHETAADLTANLDWLAKTQELLGKAAVLAGVSENWKAWIEKSQAVVAPDPDPSKAHLAARLFLDKMCHESMAGTGAICTTACSRIPGSVVNRVIGDAMELDTLEISHAVGTMAVFVQTEMPMKDEPIFETLSFVRTVRRIMDGTIYVPDSFRPDAPAKRSVSNVLPLGYGFIFN